MALNERQKKFCNEYLVDLNATQAAIRAGYSKKTAAVIGAENLIKPNIQNFVQEQQKKLQEKTGITQERVLQEYAKIAFFDIRNVFDSSGRLIDVIEFDETAAGAVISVEVDKIKTEYFKRGKSCSATEQTITKKIKIADKKGALDSLAKHLGMFEKDNAQKKADIDFTNAIITFK